MSKAEDGPIPIEPIGKLVAIRVHKVGTTAKGVILPDRPMGDLTDDYQTPSGTVVAVGPDVKQCKVGDMVFVHGANPVGKFRYGRHECVFINEEHVMCVWRG